MKSLDLNEGKLWLRRRGLQDYEMFLHGTIRVAHRRCLVPTEGRDGLSVFDLARFFHAQLPTTEEALIWIVEKGPYTEAEEMQLFDAYMTYMAMTSKACIMFDRQDGHAFVAVMAMCLLFRWDFGLIDNKAELLAIHSHDNGLGIFRVPEEMLEALSTLGFAKEKESGSSS